MTSRRSKSTITSKTSKYKILSDLRERGYLILEHNDDKTHIPVNHREAFAILENLDLGTCRSNKSSSLPFLMEKTLLQVR